MEFGRMGFDTTGIDIAPRLIETARRRAGTLASFRLADARYPFSDSTFDVAICLYDVLGSSAVPEDDDALLRNVWRALKPGGYFVATVLNTRATLHRLPAAHLPDDIAGFVEALEALPPSTAMEATGSIFDPSKLLYFNGFYYRKEQFSVASWHLPAELVVRDKRYDARELAAVVTRAGFQLLDLRPVQAGEWAREPPLRVSDERAKELFVIAQKPVDMASSV
jgi:SAM-dependent methyltransferase